MAPIIFSGVTSLANTLLHDLTNTTEAVSPAQSLPQIAFDSILKARSLTGTAGVTPVTSNEATEAIMSQLLQQPEVAASLGGQNLPPGSKLAVTADGSLVLTRPDGYSQALPISPETRILASSMLASIATAGA